MAPTATGSTEAKPPRTEAKNTEETITVTGEPNSENKGDDANHFTRSKLTARTPPQQKASPAPLEGPGVPTRNPKRAMTPFDTEEGEVSDSEEAESANSPTTMPATPKSLVETLNTAMETLRQMRTSGQNATIRVEVLRMLGEAIQQAGKHNEHDTQAPQQAEEADRNTDIANDIKEIKAAVREIIAAKPRTWAQAASGPRTARADLNRGEAPGWRQRQEKLRRERAKTEVPLTTRNASEETREGLNRMNESQIVKSMKDVMVQAKKDPNYIEVVRKTPNHGLRIRCSTKEAAEEVRTMDWKTILGGSEVIKPQYGVVIHGASKLDTNFDTQKPDEIIKRIADVNKKIHIKRVAPLRKRTRNPNASAQSIIIFTEDPAEADGCIDNGIYIGNQCHAAERYMPQCQIKQCFNCQGYGHTASICTGKKVCGNCGKDHETRECKSKEAHCVQCQGPHPAWHHECSVRKRENMRLETMRDELSHWFTK